MTETQEYGYSPESAQQELSNEYQHDMVWMVFIDLCVLVLALGESSLSIGRVKSYKKF